MISPHPSSLHLHYQIDDVFLEVGDGPELDAALGQLVRGRRSFVHGYQVARFARGHLGLRPSVEQNIVGSDSDAQ